MLDTQIHVFESDIVELLDCIHRAHGIAALYSLEETGLAATYRRDQAVAQWLEQRGIPWWESPSNGVQRAHRDTPGWQRALKTLESRLNWHCHFIQKFEME